MQEKDTNELEKALGKTHLSDYEDYLDNNQESMISEANSFPAFII